MAYLPDERMYMEENQFSYTALGAAYARGYHAMHDEPKVFNDFLAFNLLPEGFRISTEQQRAMKLLLLDPERAASCPDQDTALACWMRDWAATALVISRARYTEDSLEVAVRQGVRQYVILGAGMDTFAFRRPDMLERLQVFEVDHPATQSFKRRRLSELGWEIPAQLYFVPVDFTQEGLAGALGRSSYDPHALSLFNWLGVTYYLLHEAVFSTLQAIAALSPAGSKVIFDYSDTGAFITEKAAKQARYLYEATRRIGEPLKTGLDSSMLSSDLDCIGLRLHEDLSPSDIEGRYFQGRTDQYHANEKSHFACAIVK